MNTAKFVRTYRFSSWVYVCTLLAEGMLGLLICGADPPCALAVWLGCRKVSFTFEFEMLEQRRVALRGRVSVSRLRSSGCYWFSSLRSGYDDIKTNICQRVTHWVCQYSASMRNLVLTVFLKPWTSQMCCTGSSWCPLGLSLCVVSVWSCSKASIASAMFFAADSSKLQPATSRS